MMIIRKEREGDAARIAHIEYTAFLNHPQHAPGAEPTEHRIVEGLREAGSLTLSLVLDIAEAGHEECLIGHIAMSPAEVGAVDSGWYLLGPVGVLPEYQRKGYGSALVTEALRGMRLLGAKGVVLVGDPAYYARFGFEPHHGLTLGTVPTQYVLGLAFGDEPPCGEIVAHDAFGC